MNEKLKQIFEGKVVNKAHTINTGVDEFPRYVLEYLFWFPVKWRMRGPFMCDIQSIGLI